MKNSTIIEIKTPSKKERSITIRLDAIFMLLVVLRLNDFISTSWITILLILVVPMLITRLIIKSLRPLVDRAKDFPSGTYKIGRFTITK